MSEISRPWNGTAVGDAGPYSDAQWQKLYQYIIGSGGIRADYGVFMGSGNPPNEGLMVIENGSAGVTVLEGSALVQGIAYMSDGSEIFPVAVNASGNPRVDTIVVRADYALQECRLTIKTGTPAASPVPPALTQSAGVMWEIPIADIAAANGFVTIVQANITPRQLWLNASAIVYQDHILNNSAVVLQDGDVVVWDDTAFQAVTTTTTRDDKQVAGVWRGRTAIGLYGRLQTKGLGYVRADAAVTIGQLLMTGTTARSASVPTASEAVLNGVIGAAVETISGAGFVLCNIDTQVVNNADFVLVQDQKASGTVGQTLTAATWNARVLTTEVLDTGGIASLAANRVTLPRGRYSIVAHASTGANVGTHRLRLRDPINNVTYVSGNNALNNSMAALSGSFELTASQLLELQHWGGVTGGSGGGAATTGEPEIYASAFFTRHGMTP